MSSHPPNLVRVEERLWVAEASIGVPGYDFRFQDFFTCAHPQYWEGEISAVARMGAAPDYAERYEQLLEWNVRLVHHPAEYELTSYLPNWYPRIAEFTPKSLWYEAAPSAAEIEAEFAWPVFIKGERQTSKHDRSLSIAENPAQFREIMERWRRDEILHWQRIVCRQFVNLRKVIDDFGKTLPKAFEFRTFWWKDVCVGHGPYWNSERYYLKPAEEAAMLALGYEVARRLGVTFLVIDLAQTEAGEWIVIECNDGQDSGYSGVSPFKLWRKVLDLIG